MVSKCTITTIAQLIAEKERDRIGNSLRNAFKEERIGKERLERILGKFLIGLKNREK